MATLSFDHSRGASVNNYCWTQSALAAQIALSLYKEDLTRLYLYYKQGAQLLPSRYVPVGGYRLAFGEHLPRNLNYRQLTQWIYDRIGTVPFLPIT